MTPTLAQLWRDAIPQPSARDPIAWMEQHVRMPGSARSERCNFAIYPWTRKPVERAALGECRTVTFVKPVQSGGSGASEALACYLLANEIGGYMMHWNWEDNTKAVERWDERLEPLLKNCAPLMAKAPPMDKQLGRWKRGRVLFPHATLVVQGVKESKNLDSDTVRFEINEEIHNWEPGRLAKAYNRTTAVWNAVIFNVSNASKKDDQLHQLFLQGTQQHWEVLCPYCGKRHRMRTRWDPKEPKLGGLRYNSEGCKVGDTYDYNKLEKTIRFQMPCGGEVHDDPVIRRRMSLGGDYSAPENPGARSNDSYTLEAVAVDYIPWLTLIQEKHAALRALKLGDPEPWWRYKAERENIFVDQSEDRPVIESVLLNTRLKKNRDGLKDRVVRFGALDYQHGDMRKGELPHWWGLIRDFDARGNSLLVWEGKLSTDEDAHQIMMDHSVKPACVVCDSGHDATHVYQFCLRYGFNAIKGGSESSYAHKDGGRRIFSPEKPLHLMLNMKPTRENKLAEPLFWFYSKAGIRDRLNWVRGAEGIRWDVPGDVSEDYQNHMGAEELRERKNPRTGEAVHEWVQVKRRNDLFVAECYVMMLAEMAGLIAPQTKGAA